MALKSFISAKAVLQTKFTASSEQEYQEFTRTKTFLINAESFKRRVSRRDSKTPVALRARHSRRAIRQQGVAGWSNQADATSVVFIQCD